VVFQSSCFYASFSCFISFSSLSLTHFLSLSVFLYRDFSLSLFLCLVFFFLPLSLISLTLFFLFLCFLLVFFSLAFSFFLLLALTFSVYLAPFFSRIFSHSFSLSLHLSFSFTNFVPLSPLSLSLLLSKFYLLLKHQDSIWTDTNPPTQSLSHAGFFLFDITINEKVDVLHKYLFLIYFPLSLLPTYLGKQFQKTFLDIYHLRMKTIGKLYWEKNKWNT